MYDEDAIYQDDDILQAQYEEEGRSYSQRLAKAEKLIAEGDHVQGQNVCPHGHVGLLTGLCSEDDPRYGEDGYRCYECGAVVTDIGGNVLHHDPPDSGAAS